MNNYPDNYDPRVKYPGDPEDFSEEDEQDMEYEDYDYRSSLISYIVDCYWKQQ